jgi:hypothetical protein
MVCGIELRPHAQGPTTTLWFLLPPLAGASLHVADLDNPSPETSCCRHQWRGTRKQKEQGVSPARLFRLCGCQAQDNATSVNVRVPHATFPSSWWPPCAAKACGVSLSRAPGGRSCLSSSRQLVIIRRASGTEVNSHRLRPPARKTPLKLAFCPFCPALHQKSGQYADPPVNKTFSVSL